MRHNTCVHHVIGIFTLLCCLVAPAGIRPALALEKATLQLKWLHHFQFAGYYAALEKGFYREAGLDVTIREGGPAAMVEDTVSAGRADFGVGTSALLLHNIHGNNLVVLGQIFQHSPAVFLTPRRTGIRSVADMAGRRFMYSNQHGDMLALLKMNGINEGGITMVPHQGDPRDLISGRADVMLAYNFNEPFVMEQAGEPYLTFSPLTSGIDFYGDNFFTTRTLLEERPEFVSAFRGATLRGWQYALSHKAEIADLILSKYSRQKSRAWLLFEANQMEALIQPDLVELGYQSPIRWQRIAETFIGLGMLPQGFDARPIIYTPKHNHDYTQLMVVSVISAAIITILAWLALTFRNINRRLAAEIVERKQAEEALRSSENFLSESQRVGRIGSYNYDVLTSTWTSTPLLDEILGIDDTYPRNYTGWLDLVDADCREQMEDYLIHLVINLKQPFDREYPIRRKVDGERRWLHGYGKLLLDETGAAVRMIGAVQDVTERRRMEEERIALEFQILKNQKIESLGVLAGGIAHDFNNILTGIMGNISFAQRLIDPSLRASALLKQAEKATQRAAGLAQQLLTFSKGGQPIKALVSVKWLIDESVALVLSGSNVKGTTVMPEDIYPLEVDEGQISQVFNNIIINAVQAMPAGGTLVVTASNLVMTPENALALAAGEYVRISFTDTGSGISEDDLKSIFDPYFTTKEKGNGLGLASAFSIVSKHGGSIGVSSVVGSGTTVEIVLPAASRAMPFPAEKNAVPLSGQRAGATVLVMDDESIIRELVAEMLGELEYQVHTCINGEEAVSLYTSAFVAGAPYAVVIMDLTIPGGMGGKEAARQILDIDPRARLIVSSGYSSDPVMAEYGNYGFCATMAKPYNCTEIAQLLEDVIPFPQDRALV